MPTSLYFTRSSFEDLTDLRGLLSVVDFLGGVPPFAGALLFVGVDGALLLFVFAMLRFK
jgi:hypothetical protein